MRSESKRPFRDSRWARAALGATLLAIVATAASACAPSEAPADLGRSPSASTRTALPTGEVPPGHDRLLVTFTAQDDGPHAVAHFRGESHEAFVASHCWSFEPSGTPPVTPKMCVDTLASSAANLSPLLEVPQGTDLVVNGTPSSIKGSIARLRTPFHPIATFDLADGNAVLGQEPGEYIASFFASWPQGDVAFFVGVEITR